jgi:anti-sigma factor RsiW
MPPCGTLRGGPEPGVEMGDLNEMSCQELVEVITDYLEGSLSPHERRRFEEHVAVCPGCRNYLEQMRTTIRLTGALRAEAMPARVREELLEAFKEWKRGRAG